MSLDANNVYDGSPNGNHGVVNPDVENVGGWSVEESRSYVRPQHDLAEPLLTQSVPRSEVIDGNGASNSFPETGASKAVVFGLINATAGIPALIAFATIVFQHPAYQPYIDLLCKFFFASSALHQAVFNVYSTLPFAMGQVQDVGIIFMSGMATSIADIAAEDGKSVETALGSALLTMTLSTVIVGMGTLLVAKKSLAGFVQYIPLPVMGGYLGFVGYFCIASGIGLGCSQDISSLISWVSIFNKDSLVKLIPTMLSCFLMVVTMEKARHPFALPALLVALVLAFHLALFVSGVSLPSAQAAGWVLPPAEGAVKFWNLWKLYHFETWTLQGIYFPAIFRQVAKTVGLLLVVIFGSCMDIAAVQQDVPVHIDFNRELTTVALSNLATGMAGVGFTGSYIFSQTIFTMRAGVFNRINGWVISIAELLVFIYPYSIVQYIPNYFLGALMTWFGFEISRDWLVLSFFKLTTMEYGILWLTFFSVMQWGLEGGIAAGILCATVYFSYAYARSQVQNFDAGRAQSSVVRTVEHQAALALLRDTHTVTAQLQGFIFFGSASSIGTKLNNIAALLDNEIENTRVAERNSMDFDEEKKKSAMLAAPKFLIIDFSKVTGLDSSGARTLAGVTRELERHGIAPILTGMGHHGIIKLLESHEVHIKHMVWPPEVTPLTERVPGRNQDYDLPMSPKYDVPLEPEVFHSFVYSFESIEDGLRFCEDALLEVAVRFGLCTAPSAGVTLDDLVSMHLQKLPLAPIKLASQIAKELKKYVHERTVRRGESLWKVGDQAEEIILVQRGVIRVDQFGHANQSWQESESTTSDPLLHPDRSSDLYQWIYDERATNRADGVQGPIHQKKLIRSFELGPGCIGGSTDFYLARLHSTHAVCASVACRVLRISKRSMQRMASESPMCLAVLQLIAMRLNSSDLFTAANYSTLMK